MHQHRGPSFLNAVRGLKIERGLVRGRDVDASDSVRKTKKRHSRGVKRDVYPTETHPLPAKQ